VSNFSIFFPLAKKLSLGWVKGWVVSYLLRVKSTLRLARVGSGPISKPNTQNFGQICYTLAEDGSLWLKMLSFSQIQRVRTKNIVKVGGVLIIYQFNIYGSKESENTIVYLAKT